MIPDWAHVSQKIGSVHIGRSQNFEVDANWPGFMKGGIQNWRPEGLLPMEAGFLQASPLITCFWWTLFSLVSVTRFCKGWKDALFLQRYSSSLAQGFHRRLDEIFWRARSLTTSCGTSRKARFIGYNVYSENLTLLLRTWTKKVVSSCSLSSQGTGILVSEDSLCQSIAGWSRELLEWTLSLVQWSCSILCSVDPLFDRQSHWTL